MDADADTRYVLVCTHNHKDEVQLLTYIRYTGGNEAQMDLLRAVGAMEQENIGECVTFYVLDGTVSRDAALQHAALDPFRELFYVFDGEFVCGLNPAALAEMSRWDRSCAIDDAYFPLGPGRTLVTSSRFRPCQ